ncbi:MAG TPA: transglycosylase domain-containing protein [Candidatus Binataceae bacterium]|nr:transglycosylase domain-containing protein [Candidatus Binataceae bacterium]
MGKPVKGRGKASDGGRANRIGALIRRIGWRRGVLGLFLICAFGFGFYLANVYADISNLIEQRRAALTSAIFSAPLRVHRGDAIAQIHLLDRLNTLSYSPTTSPAHPGEYSMTPGAMAIDLREFSIGTRAYPAGLVRLTFDHDRVAGIADAFGVAMAEAVIEPEVIGHLLPDAPAERVEVALTELPPYLTQGLIATEDRFFYYHFGFDPIRIIEAAVVDLRSHRMRQGASTLTQQLARTFLDSRTRSLHRKVRELAVALVLEMRLSKNEILERYINDVAMGEYDGTPVYGMPLAARYYFNKDLARVSPAEAATLIGMIQAPTLDDPRRHPEASRARRDTVLALMHRAHLIDDAQYAGALAEAVVTTKPAGLRRAPYFADYVIEQVTKLPGVSGHLSGLRVYTTLQPELQASAQEAVTSNLARLERAHPRLRRRDRAQRLESSLVTLDPHNGAIVAMVGGRDYAASQFNRVVSAERQPGSAFKPIVYLAALDPALSPLTEPVTLASILPDRPMSFGGWTPVNYERTYQGEVTVTSALAESLNVPTAYLGSLLGPPAIVRTAHLLGIRSKLPNYLPVAIGAGEVTLLDLAAVYQVFASGGIARPPYAVEAVTDAQGHLIYQHQDEQTRLMSSAIAYLMTGALQAVFQYGTAAGAANLGLDFAAAGKTGTTDDYRDAYFMGYTRQLVTGVWVGFDEPQTIGLSGAQAALPAWVTFMIDAVRQPELGFGEPPAGITMLTVDPSSGGIATPACPRQVSLPFLSGTEPTHICPLHGGLLAAAGAAPATAPGDTESATTTPPSGAPASPATPATNSAFGAIGNFFGSLFGKH